MSSCTHTKKYLHCECGGRMGKMAADYIKSSGAVKVRLRCVKCKKYVSLYFDGKHMSIGCRPTGRPVLNERRMVAIKPNVEHQGPRSGPLHGPVGHSKCGVKTWRFGKPDPRTALLAGESG